MIVVTLTSWTKRINNVLEVVKSVMSNSLQPDRLYLNLSKTEFEGIELPKNLTYFKVGGRRKHKNNEQGISYIEIS